MAERRLAITIKGGVSLGAYEAGVLTETLNLIAYNNRAGNTTPKWYIDALAGASAGSVTAAMTALALLSGDPAILHEVWINLLSLDALAPATDPKLNDNQLLDSRMLDQLAHDNLRLMAPVAGRTHPALRPEGGEIRLRFTLSHLIGEPHFVPTISGENFGFNVFKDFASFRIACDPTAFELACDNGFAADGYAGPRRVTGSDAWNALIQCAISSGSFPFAFAPRHLRKWDDVLQWADAYYQDGGVYDNDPVGQSINLAHDIDWYGGAKSAPFQDDERRYLIVHTEPFKSIPKAIIPGASSLLVINPFKLAMQLVPNVLQASMTSGLAGISEVNQLFAVRRGFLATLVTEAATNTFPALGGIVDLLAGMRKVQPDHLNALRASLIADLARGPDVDDINIGDKAQALTAPQQNAFVEAALAFDLALDIADKVQFHPMLVAPEGRLSGGPVDGFGGFLVKDLRERDFRQGVADAYRQWAKVAERNGDFVVPQDPPAPPRTVDEVAKIVETQYAAAAERLLERIEAVITGLAEGITDGQGLIGVLKAKAIEFLGSYFAKKFAASK